MTNNTNEITNQTNHLAMSEANTDFMKPDTFVKTQDKFGKYSRRLVYSALSTVPVPESREGLIALTNMLNGSDENAVNQCRENIGVTFELENVIIKPYTSLNEETGEEEHGCVTYLFAKGDPKPYVTSSKSVYLTLKNFFAVFGIPNTPNYLGLTVTIVSKAGRDHKYIDLDIK